MENNAGFYRPKPSPWPWQRSLQHRIVLTYGTTFFVVLVLLMIWVGGAVYTAQLRDAKHNLTLQAFLAANTLEDPLSGFDAEFEAFAHWEEAEHEAWDHDEGDDEDDDEESERNAAAPAMPRLRTVTNTPEMDRLAQIVQVYALDTAARVTILNASGIAIADSQNATAELANQLDRREVQAALRGEEPHDIRIDPLTGRRTLFVAAPVRQGEQLLGLVRLARPLDEIAAEIWALLLRLAALGLLALAAATLLGILLARRLVRPLQGLEQASLAIAGGDLTQRVPVATSDEIGALAGAFNYMAQELARMMAQQRQFVASASHELRTPLTNIKLRSEALLAGVDEPEIRWRYLAEIDGETDRLGRLAAVLLDLSRLEARPHPPSSEAVDVRPTIQRAARIIQMQAAQKGVAVTVDLPEQLPFLCIWPDHLEAILVNLLDNAVKYSPKGGEISLSARATSNDMQIRVQDSGIGIPPDDLDHVFEPFYRVDKARSRQSGPYGQGSGAGLGLSIVKTLVEQNGGAIQVSSKPDEGTEFSIRFPSS